MLGSELLKVLIAPGNQVFAPSEHDTDIANEAAVFKAFADFPPDCVIHAAAYTNVDGAESNHHIARRVNADGTANIARAAAKIDASMLYMGTDFVFDGRKREPYLPDDTPHPLGVYATSKLNGERHMGRLLDRYWIVRTAWLFGARGRNFVRTVLEKADKDGELQVVDDQIGCPTYAVDLAHAISEIVGTDKYGIWHVTNSGQCSWFEFAREALALSGRSEVKVKPIPSARLDRAARRPLYSVLANPAGANPPFTPLRDWREALAAYLAEIGELDEGTPLV